MKAIKRLSNLFSLCLYLFSLYLLYLFLFCLLTFYLFSSFSYFSSYLLTYCFYLFPHLLSQEGNCFFLVFYPVFLFVFLFLFLSFDLLLLSFSSSSSSGRRLYFSRYLSSSSCDLLTASSRSEPLKSGSFLSCSIFLTSPYIINCGSSNYFVKSSDCSKSI